MIYSVYAIRDSVAGEYLAPMLDLSNATAMRNFRHTVMTTAGTMQTHRQDYDLYLIGTYNSESASFQSSAPELVLRGGDIK